MKNDAIEFQYFVRVLILRQNNKLKYGNLFLVTRKKIADLPFWYAVRK